MTRTPEVERAIRDARETYAGAEDPALRGTFRILAAEVERLEAQLSSARASLRSSIPNDVAFARKRDYDAMEERAETAEAQLKGTMEAGGYEHFTAQVRNAQQQAHNAIYVAQQLEKKAAELEAQNARLRAALGLADVWPLFDVLAKLCEAVQHMRRVQQRDAHGHEQWYHAADAGERLIPQIKAALADVRDWAKHPDDTAVEKFATAMKAKLAAKREQGYYGWDDKADCSQKHLVELLNKHVLKGDPVDVGNFAMMLWNRGESTRLAETKGTP